MPAPISQTVSFSKKIQPTKFEPEEVFLSETFVLLPGEKPAEERQKVFLELKAQAMQLLTMDPDEQGFKTADQHQHSAPEPPAGEPNAETLHKVKTVDGGIPADCLNCGAKPRKGDPNIYTVSTLEMHESKHWQVLYHAGCKKGQKESQIKVRK